jgi:hypothetical protein
MKGKGGLSEGDEGKYTSILKNDDQLVGQEYRRVSR